MPLTRDVKITDYSQHGEQQVITDYFGQFIGTLLDIGSNDGKTFSNSRALLEKGWYGVLVEPSEVAFKMLQENNQDFVCQLHNVAIGEYSGMTDFYESGSLCSSKDHSLVSSMKEKETRRWRKKSKPSDPIVEFTKTKVPVIPLAQLIKESMCDTFEFVSIDTEGMELEILRQMNFEAMGTRLICVEYNRNNYEDIDKLIPFPLVYKNKTNAIYGKIKSYTD